jgi:hypothetical protein
MDEYGAYCEPHRAFLTGVFCGGGDKIHMTIFWPAFIGGLLATGIGTGIVLYRTRAASTSADRQRDTFGRAGERVARYSTPVHMVTTGIGIVFVGVVGIVLSLLNLNW